MYSYRNIKCLQELAWGVTDLRLRGKYIEMNELNSISMEDEI